MWFWFQECMKQPLVLDFEWNNLGTYRKRPVLIACKTSYEYHKVSEAKNSGENMTGSLWSLTDTSAAIDIFVDLF